MCLDTVSKIELDFKDGYGYKLFLRGYNGSMTWTSNEGNNGWSQDSYTGLYYRDNHYKVGKWYKSSNGIVHGNDYETGFHIFIYLQDALLQKRYIFPCDPICKVEYRKAILFGTELNPQDEESQILVAKEMKILEEIE